MGEVLDMTEKLEQEKKKKELIEAGIIVLEAIGSSLLYFAASKLAKKHDVKIDGNLKTPLKETVQNSVSKLSEKVTKAVFTLFDE